MSQGFTKNFAQLASVRFILGLVEGMHSHPPLITWLRIIINKSLTAPFLPAVFFLLSCWYTRAELPPRIAVLYGGNMLATAFSGLIAAGSMAIVLARTSNDELTMSSSHFADGRRRWKTFVGSLSRVVHIW